MEASVGGFGVGFGNRVLKARVLEGQGAWRCFGGNMVELRNEQGEDSALGK